VEVNCNRFPTKRATGSILQSQMSNVEWAQCRGIVSDFVVFQASNSMWLKTGMETYVEKHVTSVPKIKSSAMCQNFKGDRNRHAYQQCEEAVKLKVESDAFMYYRDPCIAPPFKGIHFVLQRKHEGSFYPTSELNRIVSMAKHNSQSHEPLKNCVAMSPNIFDTPFWIEEIYFQTWFANHETIEGTGDVMCVFLRELSDTEYGKHTAGDKAFHHIPFFLSMEGIFLVKHPAIRENVDLMSALENEFGMK